MKKNLGWMSCSAKSLLKILLLATSLVSGCGHDELLLPPDQRSFSRELADLRARYQLADDTKNSVQMDRLTDEARRFFKVSPRIEAWVGTVEGVNDFVGERWASVEAGDVSFKLRPGNDEASQNLVRLVRGDTVEFSGAVVLETNITIGRAIRDTELVIEVFEIERAVARRG